MKIYNVKYCKIRIKENYFIITKYIEENDYVQCHID